jgi:tetratricopeptide (TPR) repeat protein
MRSLPGALIALALAYLTFILFREARVAYASETVDSSRVVLLFGGVVILGVAAGVLFVSLFMPVIGEWIGNFFFNPDEEQEKGPHADALAAIARGDYQRAIEEYRDAFAKDETDTLALSEIVRLSCDKLHDCDAAAAFLEEALERDWPPEDAAFLSTRLVDVYWNHQHNAARARAMLLQIIETLPNSKFAANAQHRLHEIERQLAQQG